MKTVLIVCGIIAVFLVISAFFLNPSFSEACTDQLIACLSPAADASFSRRFISGWQCFFQNIGCLIQTGIHML